MGEPAVPTLAERLATLELARSIVTAERCDESWPESVVMDWVNLRSDADIERYWAERAAVHRLAQDLAATYDAPPPEPRIFRAYAGEADSAGLVVIGANTIMLAEPDDARRMAAALLRAADKAEAARPFDPSEPEDEP